MLKKTLEFLRIADVQPTDEKVRKRTESATELMTHVIHKDQHEILLAFLQGIVGGFEAPVFAQDSTAVVLLIKVIKDRDATLPSDLKENAMELRAIAGVAVGELLTNHAGSAEAMLAALSIRSALSSRPAATEKHVRWMLETLLAASDKVLEVAAQLRRRRGTPALQHLGELERPAEDTDGWKTLLPAVISALQEVNDQERIHREEIETLWWMFAAFSAVEQKPLAEISSPSAAAFCSGFELAQRALLPPSASAIAMVKRAVESGRKPATLGPVSLQDAAAAWSEAMINGLSPIDGSMDDIVSHHPALLPISWVCRRLREGKDAQKLGKEVKATTGIPLNQSHTPTNWGAQIFRETILQRALFAP